MLKKRIIANVVVRNGIVVQSIGFKKYLPVGKPHIALEFFNQWGIDEIILTDISATASGRHPDYEMVRKASAKSYVPLTVGGGISHIDHIRELMHCGADKIALNQSAIKNPAFITQAAHVFGNQCVVVSIDVVRTDKGYRVYDYIHQKPTSLTPEAFALEAEKAGAGELLINSVDRDGSYQGFDCNLINIVCNAVTIPVIACGGARHAGHFVELFQQTKASAGCAANMFHFTEHSVITTKSVVNKHIDIRLETHADYRENEFDSDFRLLKKPDNVLEEMLYLKIEKEII
jgi:cyclase